MAGNNKNTIQPGTDRELLVRIGRGDQRAFAEMVQAHWNTIYSHCLAYLKSAQRSEEVTQDIFMKIWTARSRLPEVQNLDNYLFILARNQLVNEMRKRIELLYGLEEGQGTSIPAPDLETEYRESWQLLLKGIEQLPEKRRQVFTMSRLEGMSNESIARALGIHKDTVYQYIVKSLVFLRTWLQEHSDNPLLNFLLFFSVSLLYFRES